MRNSPRSIVSVVALTAATVWASPTFALHAMPVVGDHGDKSVHAECPPGQTMVGFSGRTGTWVDAIQLVCAPINGQPVAIGPRYGGAGGRDTDSLCPKGWRMQNVSLNMTTHLARVAAIEYSCKSRKTGETNDNVFGDAAYVSRCPGIGVGNCNSTNNEFQPCAADEEPVGFNVNYGKDVNAFGLICGRATGTR